MARRFAGKPIKPKGSPALTLEGFKSRTGVDLEAALVALGPEVRNLALDDSRVELLIAWGRCAERRVGLALVIEDVIRAMTPMGQKNWRENICRCALGEWHDPKEKV